MCFSATASFTVSGINALIGLAILHRRPKRREIPLASFPLLFAFQQFAEGLVWLSLHDSAGGAIDPAAPIMLFILFAEVLWPILTPISILMIEPDRQRQRLLRGLAFIGLLVAGYLFHASLNSPVSAEIHNGSIRYFNDFAYLTSYRFLYVVAICGPLLLQSRNSIRVFGVLVFLGYVASLYLYTSVLISVWCFFAAAASGVLYLHFPHTHRA